MGKTYIDTVKYVVHADLEIDGIVEKPDVVVAIFGQTEGLLGDELDLRELQKSGRIGRIEVEIHTKNGKSIGEIILPSSLDRIETAILAAALETVDRVGPCEARITVRKIEDTRTMKRKHVVERAKELIKGMMSEIMPERKEISELVLDEVKLADVQQYGPEKIAAGPNIDEAEHIIVVEGRADVLNLLKADIRNVIALQGKIIPKTVQELSKKKTVTAFIDGDRGGDLIIRQLADCAEVDYVARAPDGKEVEELTKKEIIKCLRNKIPFEQYLANISKKPYRNYSETRRYQSNKRETRENKNHKDQNNNIKEYLNKLSKLEGTLKGVIMDKTNKIIAEADVKDLSKELQKAENAETVIFDGIITQRIVDVAKKAKIKTLVGVKSTRINDKEGVRIITKEGPWSSG